MRPLDWWLSGWSSHWLPSGGDSSSRRGAIDDATEVFGREEIGDRDGSRQGTEEAVRVRLVMQQRTEELLHLGWRRLERGQLARQCIARHRSGVALELIVGERLLDWLCAREAGVDRVCQELGVAERVANAER